MVERLERARRFAVAAERVEHFERLAVQDVDQRVALIRDVQELLLRVR